MARSSLDAPEPCSPNGGVQVVMVNEVQKEVAVVDGLEADITHESMSLQSTMASDEKQLSVEGGLERTKGAEKESVNSTISSRPSSIQSEKDQIKSNKLFPITSIKHLKDKRKRLWISFFVSLLLVVSIIVGVVVGLKRRKKSPSLKPSQKIQTNSTLAMTKCPNGDRWAFFKDGNDVVRAASTTLGAWRAITDPANITADARSDTPLSASCVELPTQLDDSTRSLSPGNLVQLIYFTSNNSLGHTYMNDNAWHLVDTTGGDKTKRYLPRLPSLADSDRSVPEMIIASPESRLTISSTIMPSSLDADSAAKNNLNMAPTDLLSSVATYQDTAGKPVMVDLLGNTARNNTSPTDYVANLLDLFAFESWNGATSMNETSELGVTTSLHTSAAGGFACSYNVPGHGNATLETKELTITSGNWMIWCVSSDYIAWANYDPYLLGYNGSSIGGWYTDLHIDQENDGSAKISDITLLPMENGRVQLLFTAGNPDFRSVSFNSTTHEADGGLVFGIPIPIAHTSGFVLNNGTVLAYIVKNETHIAEMTINTETNDASPDYVGYITLM